MKMISKALLSAFAIGIVTSTSAETMVGTVTEITVYPTAIIVKLQEDTQGEQLLGFDKTNNKEMLAALMAAKSETRKVRFLHETNLTAIGVTPPGGTAEWYRKLVVVAY